MAPVIQTRNLSKSYATIQAIKDVNLEVNEGEVFGYLGPNGAGKTTTIRTLLDLIRPTGGSASVFGLDSRRDSAEIRGRVGYLSGDIALYDRLTGQEVLTYLASLRGGVDPAFLNELSERFQCTLDQPVRSLSRGNRQKLGLVQAFMHKPELVIMDEPSSGLDPLMQQEFHELVEETQGEGRTVFISSHILPEVERVCNRVGIIRGGELIAVEEVADLKERAFHQLEFHFGEETSMEEFADLPGVKDVTLEDGVLKCTVVGKPDSLIKAVARFEVVKLVSHDSTLEDIFLSYYGEGEADAA